MDPGLAAVLAGLVGSAGGTFGAWTGARATRAAAQQAGLDAQSQRQRELRRTAYADFAVAAGKADSLLAASWAFRDAPDFDHVPASLPAGLADLDRARVIVGLEGPGELSELADAITRSASLVGVSIPEYKNEVAFRRDYEEVAGMIAQFTADARAFLARPAEPPSRPRFLGGLIRRRPAQIGPAPAAESSGAGAPASGEGQGS